MQCREGDWDLYWCDVGWMKEYFDHYYMEEHMKLCHFRNHYEALNPSLCGLFLLLERDYVTYLTFRSLLSQIRLSSVTLSVV